MDNGWVDGWRSRKVKSVPSCLTRLTHSSAQVQLRPWDDKISLTYPKGILAHEPKSFFCPNLTLLLFWCNSFSVYFFHRWVWFIYILSHECIYFLSQFVCFENTGEKRKSVTKCRDQQGVHQYSISAQPELHLWKLHALSLWYDGDLNGYLAVNLLPANRVRCQRELRESFPLGIHRFWPKSVMKT